MPLEVNASTRKYFWDSQGWLHIDMAGVAFDWNEIRATMGETDAAQRTSPAVGVLQAVRDGDNGELP